MPSKSKKRPRGRFDFSRFVPLLQILLLVSTFGNFLVIFFFERSRTPQKEYVYSTVTTNHIIVVTNFLSSSSLSYGGSHTNKNALLQKMDLDTVNLPYHYFMSGRYPHFRMYGRNFSIGSPTSYGRVRMIFPDRIELENGVWIKNTTPFKDSFVNNSEEKKSKTNANKKGLKND